MAHWLIFQTTAFLCVLSLTHLGSWTYNSSPSQMHGMPNILASSVQPSLLDPYPVPGSVRGPGIQ